MVRHSAEQIDCLLRHVDVDGGKDVTVPDDWRRLGILPAGFDR
jgi:hypothetical protein